MLQSYDESIVDYTIFHCEGQGYASFIYKISLWFGEQQRLTLPEIGVLLSAKGALVLKDNSVIPYIAIRLGIPADCLGSMVQTDMDAMQPNTSFLYANDFKPPEQINLAIKPKKFCITCFMNSLLSEKIPVFDACMQSPWATHCIWHLSPLLPTELLENQNSYDTSWGRFDDGSQFRHWCNRVEETRQSLTDYRVGRSFWSGSAVSDVVIAINRLFYNAAQAELGVAGLGLKAKPEKVRQKLYTVFYVLSRQYSNWSLGREMTRGRTRGGCFPTSRSFSPELLELLTLDQKHRCIEYIAHFILNPQEIHPYLLTQEMRSARIDYTQQRNEPNEEMHNNPMMCLAWILHQHFEKGFCVEVEKLFPQYASEWTANYQKMIV